MSADYWSIIKRPGKVKEQNRFHQFLFLWIAECISQIGSGLTAFGLSVYVFAQTGSAADTALVTLLAFLPMLLLSVPAGVLADRYDRRLLMMAGDGCSAIGVLFILVCVMQGNASLLQICIGVLISSVFAALLEPAYKSTITDLLTEEEFSRAGGLVSLAGSVRYLVAPALAGILLAVSDIRILLLIDISTFVLTVFAAAMVRRSIEAKRQPHPETFLESMSEGWRVLRERRGVLLLAVIASGITFFMGVLQILIKPMVLSFADAKQLGFLETFSACGMLVSGIYLGVRGIKKRHVTVLSISLALSGLFMAGMGLSSNKMTLCSFGFLFFAMLPFANNCLDYLTRINIPNEVQGRTWGLIGLISQLGYVVAYAISGAAADLLSASFGWEIGRSCAMLILVAGVLLVLTAMIVLFNKNLSECVKENRPF
ncbi:MAG: MFS transporter [Lachnospiraceae bacterium]|nr:MFS transporter [Lachnospiraceae bacterium]